MKPPATLQVPHPEEGALAWAGQRGQELQVRWGTELGHGAGAGLRSRARYLSVTGRNEGRLAAGGEEPAGQAGSCLALTGLEDPLQVPVELPLDLLLPPQLQEGPAVLHPLALLGKLSVVQGPKVRRSGEWDTPRAAPPGDPHPDL